VDEWSWEKSPSPSFPDCPIPGPVLLTPGCTRGEWMNGTKVETFTDGHCGIQSHSLTAFHTLHDHVPSGSDHSRVIFDLPHSGLNGHTSMHAGRVSRLLNCLSRPWMIELAAGLQNSRSRAPNMIMVLHCPLVSAFNQEGTTG
jgi:hypothetical protein